MTALAALAAAYVLSQFYRAFLAVLSPVLGAEIGADATDLSRAAGLWFLAFALMQIPVGAALDRYGPRRTAGLLLGLGAGGGALLFAAAEGPGGVALAMALIGAGCAPVLVAAYFVIARTVPPARFALWGASLIGVGSLGNLGGAAPLAATVAAFGWRATMAGLGALTIGVALLLLATLRDPPRAGEPGGAGLRGYLAVLRLPGFALVLPVMFACYAPQAGIRGLWAGPWLQDRFGAGPEAIGAVTFAMALGMAAGNFFYAPLDRLFGTRKGVVMAGNLVTLGACLWLALAPAPGPFAAGLALVLLGFFGSSYAMVMAHGRSFVPAALTGRGITLLNFFGIGGVGLLQLVTGELHAAAGGSGAAAWTLVFGTYAAAVALGLLAYRAVPDRTD